MKYSTSYYNYYVTSSVPTTGIMITRQMTGVTLLTNPLLPRAVLRPVARRPELTVPLAVPRAEGLNS